MLLGHTHPQIVFYLGGMFILKSFEITPWDWEEVSLLHLPTYTCGIWLQTEWQSEKLFLLKSAVIKRRIISSSFSNAWTREACGGGAVGVGVGGGGGLLPSPLQESSKSHLNFHSVPSQLRGQIFSSSSCVRGASNLQESLAARACLRTSDTLLYARGSPPKTSPECVLSSNSRLGGFYARLVSRLLSNASSDNVKSGLDIWMHFIIHTSIFKKKGKKEKNLCTAANIFSQSKQAAAVNHRLISTSRFDLHLVNNNKKDFFFFFTYASVQPASVFSRR